MPECLALEAKGQVDDMKILLERLAGDELELHGVVDKGRDVCEAGGHFAHPSNNRPININACCNHHLKRSQVQQRQSPISPRLQAKRFLFHKVPGGGRKGNGHGDRNRQYFKVRRLWSHERYPYLLHGPRVDIDAV